MASHAMAGVEAFSLPWRMADSGGGESQGAGYTLAGTIGQPEAGSLSGGFRGGAAAPAPPQHRLFLPVISRK